MNARSKWRQVCTVVLLAATRSAVLDAQEGRLTTLTIDVENTVFYQNDVADVTKYASDPGRTSAMPVRVFNWFMTIGDITSINGAPAKGVLVTRGTGVGLNPNAQPGQSIADVARIALERQTWVIVDSNGREIGSLTSDGLRGGPPGPGTPANCVTASWAITGGTGAFLGARGQACTAGIPTQRFASASEDPSRRRSNGGGSGLRQILQFTSTVRPQIAIGPTGPAVVHANDFTPVAPGRPARRGEMLALFATGLGPTQPVIEPGNPFPPDDPRLLSLPVQIMVDGHPAGVLFAGGYAGSVDGFQVNFRVPDRATPGKATLAMSVAWNIAPEVQINIE